MDDERAAFHLSARLRVIIALGLVALAIVHLFWPEYGIDVVFLGLLAFAALLLFADIESIEWLGIKARVRKLEEQKEAVEEAPLPPPPPPAEPPRTNVPSSSKVFRPTIEHRKPADLTPPPEPASRVLWTAEQIRIELVILAGNAGYIPPEREWHSYRSLDLARILVGRNVLPDEFEGPLRGFLSLRNDLAHGRSLAPEVIKSADELGIALLIRLRELPRNYVRVLEPSVPLFLDRSLTAPHELSPGIMLRQSDKAGKALHVQVFPKVGDYAKGRYVTWEWDFTCGSDQEAWYAGEGGVPVLAFSSSACFAGREYPDQWGLRYRGGSLDLDLPT